jgi:hypothetical protein
VRNYKADIQSQYWTFTSFPYNNDEHMSLKHPLVKWGSHQDMWPLCTYLIYQRERCEETGRVHIQGYVELKKRVRFEKLKALFPNTHFEQRKGTAKQASDYCQKPDSYIDMRYEFGELSNSYAGKRNDIDNAVEMLKQNGGDMLAVAEAFPAVYVRNHRGLVALRAALAPRRVEQSREIIVLWGTAGTGKSMFATLFDDVYRPDRNNQGKVSFESYSGQKTVFIDEFSGVENLNVSDLKMICDRYSVNLPGRGVSVEGNFDRVILASNVDPRLWYTNSDAVYWKPFVRRVTAMFHCESKEFWKQEVFEGEELVPCTEFDPQMKFGLVMSQQQSVVTEFLRP